MSEYYENPGEVSCKKLINVPLYETFFIKIESSEAILQANYIFKRNPFILFTLFKICFTYDFYYLRYRHAFVFKF
jgi:hypothetical protein